MQTIAETADGSFTLYVENLDEHYHSIHGAIQESMHVFINAGLAEKYKLKNHISILEMGFGTGLNTLLTFDFANKNNIYIDYHTIEKYPIQNAICNEIYNNNSYFNHPYFWTIHDALHQEKIRINEQISFTKHICDIKNFNSTEQFDLIYYDAFAPSAQPDLWTEMIFNKMYNLLKNEGFLVTYCAKGSVKRTLKSVGFNVEALPGPKGKREMTKAIK